MDFANLDPVVTKILIDIVLGLFAAVLTAIGLYFKGLVGQNERDLIHNIVSDAVHYAEQTGIKEKLVKGGELKLVWATEYASIFLAKYGIKISAEQLRLLIEQAVHKELNF